MGAKFDDSRDKKIAAPMQGRINTLEALCILYAEGPSTSLSSSLPLSLPSPPLPLEVGPKIQLWGLGERCKLVSSLSAGPGAPPQPESNFSLKI
jgi:hypothetical protein